MTIDEAIKALEKAREVMGGDKSVVVSTEKGMRVSHVIRTEGYVYDKGDSIHPPYLVSKVAQASPDNTLVFFVKRAE